MWYWISTVIKKHVLSEKMHSDIFVMEFKVAGINPFSKIRRKKLSHLRSNFAIFI